MKRTSDQSRLQFGETALPSPPTQVSGSVVERDRESYYKIANYDAMRPFFISVVSGYDHWLFISSTGGLTCGRRAPEQALFPYCTDDKIHDARQTTGPKTIFRVSRGGRDFLWQPFDDAPRVYETERNLYKSATGHRLLFEEINHSLGLTFSYSWATSNRLGFVRRATLTNHSSEELEVELLDGLRNMLPSGVDRGAQSEMSTLVDGYKQVEAVPDLSAAICTLSSILTDRAEPNEALSATVAWSVGLDSPTLLLCEDQLDRFSRGEPVLAENYSKGKRAALFVHATLTLAARSDRNWYLIADVEQGPSQTVQLLHSIRSGIRPETIEREIGDGAERLRRLAGSADAFQESSDPLVDGRHFSNTLCNIMRGGTFPHGYLLPREDFLDFIDSRNRASSASIRKAIAACPDPLTLDTVIKVAQESGDATFLRLAFEYLPLTFSRRHGDPSRPWNHFTIRVQDEDGQESLDYQGNWRDIFQNWEALALSYPEYIESFVAKFLNASTPDGHNPYRISRDGIDWEVPEPELPWSNIGYWGGHQIVYLDRLVRLSKRYHPGRLSRLLSQDCFTYADVPYRIRPYAALCADPRESVDFDDARHQTVVARVEQIGADGRLVTLRDGSIYQVNLLEKLLVPALAKLASLVPGGGIWMNTQRPEWNDANNALVGFGLSMVTACHLRRYLESLEQLIAESDVAQFDLSVEVRDYFEAIHSTLNDEAEWLGGAVGVTARKRFVDAMGAANDRYRGAVYGQISGLRRPLDRESVEKFCRRARRLLEHSIDLNRRDDGLYHAYNLIRFEQDGIDVEKLDEMLEGQVAVLSSGYLDAAAASGLLDSLRQSRLYREDQNSYILYPDRKLPSFLRKNLIPSERIDRFEWLQRELDGGHSHYVERDIEGRAHFNSAFRNLNQLKAAMDADESVEPSDRERLYDLYESVFNHRKFTGRSGSMFKYEGLGCIYWHMVSKLLLTTGEQLQSAASSDSLDAVCSDRLYRQFTEIQDGIGLHKNPQRYGAFPADPYSHTTGFSGVQQPGLTGQVKEDVIARFLQLGVEVRDGELRFEPRLLGRDAFNPLPTSWSYATADGDRVEPLPSDSLAFTLCGVPVIYRIGAKAQIETYLDGALDSTVSGNRLGARVSQSLFRRDPKLSKLVVSIPETTLR